jgi:GNAT superfamily N-acetyltransferase
LRVELQSIPEFVAFRSLWARADDELVARGGVQWTKTDENKHMLFAGISVLPEFRRRGIGKAMLRLILGMADQQDRTLVVTTTSDRVPAGEAFARRVGAEPAMPMHTNRLVLANVDRNLLSKWIDEAATRASGYSLIAVDGAYPDDLIEPIVDVAHVMNDAPRDDLQMEDQKMTVEQMKQVDEMLLAQEVERWSLFVRHDASGDLVGLTAVYWDSDQPETVGQGDTGVRPEHRGHALGKWLKATMLRRILSERPGVKDVRTGNADSNDAMLGINRELGFEPYIAIVNWQATTDRIREYVEEE